MPKIETTSKASLRLLSRINLGRRGACTKLSTLDTAHKPPHSVKRVVPRLKRAHHYYYYHYYYYHYYYHFIYC